MSHCQPVAWMVYTQDGQSCYATDNPADISPNQRALPLYTEPSSPDEVIHPAITHCDNCGCDWLDNGLNPVGCPYCKQSSEVEALRAEVERANSWNERVSVCRDHVADIVDGICVICVLDAAEARADKLRADVEALRAERDALREALEEIRGRTCINEAMHPNPFELTAMLGYIYQIADAALSKENSND